MKTTVTKLVCFLVLIPALACSSSDRITSQKHFVQLNCSLKPITLGAAHAALRIRNADGTALNWSGYTVATNLQKPKKGSVSNVAGQWVVPGIYQASSDDAFCSTWVGMDGYSSPTVEQIGTEDDWTPVGEQDYAWFEMYPDAGYEIMGFPVAPGDQIGAGVRSSGNGKFVLAITNYSAGAYYIVPASYSRSSSAVRSSGEWIVEAPSMGNNVLPLSDFDTISFADCKVVVNGVKGSIVNAKWQFEAMTMEASDGAVMSVPSNLSANGTGFSVAWYNE